MNETVQELRSMVTLIPITFSIIAQECPQEPHQLKNHDVIWTGGTWVDSSVYLFAVERNNFALTIWIPL